MSHIHKQTFAFPQAGPSKKCDTKKSDILVNSWFRKKSEICVKNGQRTTLIATTTPASTTTSATNVWYILRSFQKQRRHKSRLLYV